MKRLLASVLAVGLFAFTPLMTSVASAGPTRAMLNRTLPQLSFDNVPLGECIDFLRDVSGANIHVNWKALEGAGVTQETPVNLRLRSVSLRATLSLLLSEAGGGEALSWQVDDRVIEITTTELANQKMFTRIYPVDDLIMEIPDFTDAPNFSLQSSSDNQSGGGGGGGGRGGGGGGGGNGLFDQDSNNDEKEPTKTRQERAEELLDLIRSVIQPEIWQENGGPATIRFYNGSLVVTAPRSVHEAIGGEWD